MSWTEKLLDLTHKVNRALLDKVKQAIDGGVGRKIYQAALKLLVHFREDSGKVVKTGLESSFIMSDKEAIKLVKQLQAKGYLTDIEVGKTPQQSEMQEKLVQEFFSYFDPAVDSVQAFMASVTREAVLKRMLMKMHRDPDKAKQILVDSVNMNMVSIMMSNGKMRRYDLPTYMQMIATSSEGRAKTAATLVRQLQNGQDLVIISDNPSQSDRCFCEAYRGRVFSISGNHSIAPALKLTPNEGPPFHPHCGHYTKPYSEELDGEVTDDMIVDENFLLKTKDDHSGNIQKRYTESLEN